MGDKVAILGTVLNSRIVVPFDDLSWDVWLCSAGNSQSAVPPRVTEWYEIHALVDLHSHEHQGWYPPYIKWLNTQTFPVWMQEKNTDVPRAQVFPYKKLTERFGPNKAKGLTNWFTSSPAWMFAFAILRGYKTIGVFGVDMAAAEEHYTGQKAGLLRWFEIARSLGIKVIVPLESTLAFDYPLYGYAEASRAGRAMIVRETELKNQINHWRQQGGEIERRIHALQGALDQVVFDRRTYITNPMDPEIDYDLDDPRDVPAEILATKPTELQPIIPATVVPASSAAIIPSSASVLPSMADFPDNPDAALLAPVKRRRRRSNGAQPVAEG